MFDDGRFTSNHLAEAAIEAPYAAAGAGVDIVDALFAQGLRPANIIDVVGIAAINDDVAALEVLGEIANSGFNHGSRNHHPGDTRVAQLGGEIAERGCA